MAIRAMGEGFFARAETLPYHPIGKVTGQTHWDSCVAACCRMLLYDKGLDVGETVIRAALAADIEGAYLSAVPLALLQLGSAAVYVYRARLSAEELLLALTKGPALAFVKESPEAAFGHVVIVDGVDHDWVLIRDPWPLASGSAYRVRRRNFEAAWFVSTDGTEFVGQAVMIE